MKLTYQGRHTEGVFVVVPGGEVFIAHGATEDVPDDVAAKLLDEQPDAFVKVTGRKAVEAEEAN
jgi:hypothetical protein